MGRIRLDNNIFLPMPVGLLGVLVEGRANFMAVGWMSRVNGNPPMIAECPLNLELKLERTVDLPSHLVCIGEIVAAYGEEDCLANGKSDYRKIDPLLLTMPDNRYWKLGEQAGNAWKDGRRQ